MTDMLFALSTMEALNPEWPPLFTEYIKYQGRNVSRRVQRPYGRIYGAGR